MIEAWVNEMWWWWWWTNELVSSSKTSHTVQHQAAWRYFHSLTRRPVKQTSAVHIQSKISYYPRFPLFYWQKKNPGLFQDFPGPKWFSRTYQVLEFSKKNPELSTRCGNPDYQSLSGPERTGTQFRGRQNCRREFQSYWLLSLFCGNV